MFPSFIYKISRNTMCFWCLFFYPNSRALQNVGSTGSLKHTDVYKYKFRNHINWSRLKNFVVFAHTHFRILYFFLGLGYSLFAAWCYFTWISRKFKIKYVASGKCCITREKIDIKQRTIIMRNHGDDNKKKQKESSWQKTHKKSFRYMWKFAWNRNRKSSKASN